MSAESNRLVAVRCSNLPVELLRMYRMLRRGGFCRRDANLFVQGAAMVLGDPISVRVGAPCGWGLQETT